ncbi:hypothetical protein SAMN04515671_2919 [Nakamurella panacisegetis]|uniref:Uncharacterized protein n=1 Tax=Nakamurella panacisegetis TaxID=1090615 RepID=A0A1H0PXK0_9ACTN|nr:hypothetical protein [Nakamurella panacisegetis]SDP09256.1 hypothetical protein SAMN04515671_2919 [Nakamurella panacisegetis]
MGRTRIVLNEKGFRELRRSPEVEADLVARGRRVAAAAGAGFEAQSWIGRNRNRVTVRTATPEARAADAREHKLLGALDAGR